MSAGFRKATQAIMELHSPYASPPSEANIYVFDLTDLWCSECRAKWPCRSVLTLQDMYDTNSDTP